MTCSASITSSPAPRRTLLDVGAHLLDNPYFEPVRHDVTFRLYEEVDAIDNLACPVSPIHDQFDPVQTTKTSTFPSFRPVCGNLGQGQQPFGRYWCLVVCWLVAILGTESRHPGRDDGGGHHPGRDHGGMGLGS
jgi:hypothetical protein